ncbi:MAG TPA: hypothetical protein VGM56_24370 [Byssovorax sp.]|jgi:hypothetical protein
MRGLLWLLGAGALIGGGGYLMTAGDAGQRAPRTHVAFPREASATQQAKEAGRRTLAPKTVAATQDQAPVAARAVAHDPLLVALDPVNESALVFEAGAILHAKVGQAFLGCMGADERARVNRKIEGADGKRWLDVADRVAFSKSTDGHGLFVLEGELDKVDFSKVVAAEIHRRDSAVAGRDRVGADATTHDHDGTTVYEITREEGQPMFAAVWQKSLVLASDDGATVERALDRLDAGGAGKLAIDESEAYGEIYGVLGPAAIARVVPEDLADRARDVTTRATVHADASDDVLLVADVEGADAKKIEDLGKSIGAAMAVGRLQAKNEGRDDMVQLLDASRVRPYGEGRLRAEVAIPTEVLTAHMKGCRKEP